jgi:hypothetical protein
MQPRASAHEPDRRPSSALERSGARGRWFGLALSVAAHGLILVPLFLFRPDKPPDQDPPVTTVQLVELQPPAPVVAPPTPAPAAPARPPPRTATARKARLAPPVAELSSAKIQTPAPNPGLSEAQLFGAASADQGPSGQPCDMARWLQAALRKDALARAELADWTGKAILVWNGDWVRDQREDGKGLAAVREAIMWEVGFAPAMCRALPVHGMILLSVPESSGAVRVALGVANWRWSDLLNARGAPPIGETLSMR